ncbi:MAG: leucine-rich repeat protein [Clostridia bacterium]|nr:leucine-rich repeat protein [Clostridia bacterium]
MKKLILLLLTAALLLSLCACGDGGDTGGDRRPSSTKKNASVTEPARTGSGDPDVWGRSDEALPSGRLFESGDFEFLDLGDGTAYALRYTGSEKEVDVPAEAEGLSVTVIWNYFFNDALETVGKVRLPASVRKIAYCAFSKTGLMQIEVDEDNPCLKSVDGVLYSGDGKTLICYPADHCSLTGVRKFELPDSVEVIAEGAFWYDYTLMVVEVGENNAAFKDVDGVVYSKDGKKIVWFPAGKPYTFYNVPEGVTEVAPYAFVCARNITQFVFCADVEYISPTAFLNCTALKHLTVDENNKNYFSDEGKILYTKDKTELVFYPPSNSTTTFSFLESTKKIGDYACFNCNFMYRAPIPEGVAEIGFDAFKYCGWLREADLPASLKVIGENAFCDCKDLTVINFAGTLAEWEEIEKGAHWNSGETPEITVFCTDGEVVLPYC